MLPKNWISSLWRSFLDLDPLVFLYESLLVMPLDGKWDEQILQVEIFWILAPFYLLNIIKLKMKSGRGTQGFVEKSYSLRAFWTSFWRLDDLVSLKPEGFRSCIARQKLCVENFWFEQAKSRTYEFKKSAVDLCQEKKQGIRTLLRTTSW